MGFERIHFAPGQEPEIFAVNICDKLCNGKHADCPGFLKYDPETMASAKATETDRVFCICPCHRKPQA
jgi:hypothetical protein